MKTHFKKLRNTNYLGSWDLMDDNGVTTNKVVTIKGTKKESVHDGKGGTEDCVIVEFNECKSIVANATNLKAIQKITSSPFIEDWVGHKIELTTKKVRAFGDVHDAIRVVPVSNAAPKLEPKQQMNNCKTLVELQNVWLGLTKEQKENADLMQLKETLKTTLK